LLVGRDARTQVTEAVGQMEPPVLDECERRRQGQVLRDRADVEDGARRDPDPPRSVRESDASREDWPPASRDEDGARETAAPLGLYDRANPSRQPAFTVERGAVTRYPRGGIASPGAAAEQRDGQSERPNTQPGVMLRASDGGRCYEARVNRP
jgi:hypothetical protein